VSVNADGTLSLLATARVHHVRPSADVLFESLAAAAGARAVVVVLSGAGSDGAPGASAVKRAGGTVVAQDRGSSEYFGMPGAAIAACAVDHVLPLEAIPAMLTRLAAREDA
jgi:two-component system chemotaxis response regulator CheB